VGDQLLVLSDDGQLVVVEASPHAYTEQARAQVLEGKCWSTPAYCNGRVYVRSTQEGACFDLTRANQRSAGEIGGTINRSLTPVRRDGE